MTNGRNETRLNRYGFTYAMTTQEVANELGLSLSTVDHIERRALVKLKEKLLDFNIDLYLTEGLNCIETGYKVIL